MLDFISGLFPDMYAVWCGAVAIFCCWLMYDNSRDHPVARKYRIWIAVAIFVCLSATKFAFEYTQNQGEPKFSEAEHAVDSCDGGRLF